MKALGIRLPTAIKIEIDIEIGDGKALDVECDEGESSFRGVQKL